MFWFDLNKDLSWCGSLREWNLHIDILDWLTPVVLLSLATIIRAYLLINFLLRHNWFWYVVAFLSLLLLLWWLNFHRFWLIFCLFNLLTWNTFNFLSSCSFKLRFLLILLELIPSLCKSLTFGGKLLLMLVLVLFIELVHLKKLKIEFYLRVLLQTLVGIPSYRLVLPRSRNQFCVRGMKILNQGDHEFRHQPAGKRSLASRRSELAELG